MTGRIIAAAAAGTICLGGMTACASRTGKNHGSPKSGAIEDEYVSIRGWNIRLGDFCDDLDKAVKESRAEAKNFKESNSCELAPYDINFSGESFSLSVPAPSNGNLFLYSGTYSVKNSRLYFDYNEQSSADSYGNITRTDRINDSSGDRISEAVISTMEELNKTGSYPTWFMPSPSASDRFNYIFVIPLLYTRRFNFSAKDCAFQLFAFEDILAAETYGISLDGSYKKGKDFVLSYDYIEMLTEDPYSYYSLRSESEKESALDTYKETAKNAFSSDASDTTIEFSEGRWEWLNHEGELINNGEYQESSDYPGLIAMYVTEDSLVTEAPNDITLTLLYLNGGKVYFPCFVSAD